MKKIKRWGVMILVCLLAITGAEGLSLDIGVSYVQAKTSSLTKKRAQETYKKFLTQKKYRYFTLWDIDKDGLKELLVTNGKDRVGNLPTGANVYAYVQGKLQYAGYIGSSMSGVSYNQATKRLQASRGGGGSIEYWYYTLTKNKKIKRVMCGAYVNGVKNGNTQYKCLYNGKRISYKRWYQITKKWIRQSKELKYYRNISNNRKKYIKI